MPDIEKLKGDICQIEACEPQGKAWKDMTPEEQAEAKRQEEEDLKLYEAERKSKLEKAFKDGLKMYTDFNNVAFDSKFRYLLFQLVQLVNNEGHSGYSIHYVYPFFKATIKDMKPLKMLEDDEYGNMIRENVNKCFEIYKEYIDKNTISKKEIETLLFLFKGLILHEPLIPINFRNKKYYSDVNGESYQNKLLYSIFIDKKIGKPHYQEAIIFFRKYKDENGKTQRDTFTTGGIAISEGNKLTVSSSAYIKQKAYDNEFKKTGTVVPKRFYIEVVRDKNDDDYIKNISDLKKVKKYYNLRYRVW